MPRSPLRTHDLSSIFVVVGTNHITAFGEAGGCVLKPNASRKVALVGAGGDVVISRSNDKNMTAELTVLRDSDDYKLLYAEMEAQDPPTGGAIGRLPFLWKNAITGEEWKTDFCAFMDSPELASEKEAGEVVFVLFLVNPTHVLPE